jgi:hypothetical protein
MFLVRELFWIDALWDVFVQKVTPEMAEAMVARLQAKVQRTADGIALLSNASPPARYLYHPIQLPFRLLAHQ